jgi:hypothetical protein
MKDDSFWRRQNAVLESGEVTSDVSKALQADQAELKAHFPALKYIVLHINSY